MHTTAKPSAWKRDPGTSTLGERHTRWGEEGIRVVLFVSALISILTTAGIVSVLIFETIEFFKVVSIWRFLTETEWTPLFANQKFGIIVLISATFLTTVIAMAVALPVGLMTAVYLSEYAGNRTRRTLKPLVELLAGVPTVVYGYFALLFVTPIIRFFYPEVAGFNALSAGLVMGVMIIPTVASLSEDALFAVPRSLREGAFALGATRRQVTLNIVIPGALSGIVASFILGISRAVGETMVVAISAGLQPNLTFDPTESAATITSYIVQVSLGDLPHESIGYQSIFAAGLVLMLMTLVFNIAGFALTRKFRQAY